MSATQQTLAQLVKAKYPGAYDDMDDSTLEQNVLAKHPEYGDLPRTAASKNIASESSMAAHPPTPQPLQMQSSIADKVGGFLGGQKFPSPQQISTDSVNAGKFGADMLGGQIAAGPIAKLAAAHVMPALKALPWAGKVIGAIDEAPGVAGKVIRGATTGGAVGGTEGLIRGKKPMEIAKDAGKGALWGGGLGAASSAINRLAPPEPFPNPGAQLPATDEFYAQRGAEINSMRKLQPKVFAPPEITPELGSPDNPGFMSKLPTKLPASLRSDPFSPPSQKPPFMPSGGASQPMEPTIYSSEFEPAQLEQRAANLKRQASAAGTYHAAQGSARKATNLQQRIGKKFLPWEQPDE